MSVKTTIDKSVGVTKAGVTITVDLATCIAAGPCAIAAGNTFQIRDTDGKAIVVDPDGDDFPALLEAAKSCPVQAITLKDKNGRQIYP